MPPLRLRAFERILLIKLSAVGDVVHALPALAKLRARYPSARIDWLIAPENADLVRCHPALSEAVPFDRRGFATLGRDWAATVRLIAALRALRRRRYDLVIDLQGQVRTAALALAAAAPVRLGFAVTRERVSAVYSHHIPVPTPEMHAADRCLQLGPVLGLDDGPPDFRIHLPPEAVAGADRLLAEAGLAGRPFALLAPGTRWETKHWPPERFAAVGRGLLRDGLSVVLAGAPGEAARCRAVRDACPEALDLCGRTTLGELAALIRRAAVCVVNDSGPMHMAAALGRPTVAIFGPTNPVRTGPYGRPEAVISAGAPCSPCYLRELRRCGHGHRCMADVAPAMVRDRVRALLAAAAPAP